MYIVKSYQPWIIEAVERYRARPAMSASLRLCAELLDFRCPENSVRYRAEKAVEHAMGQLRAHGVTPNQVFIRVAAVAAWIADHPNRIEGPNWERHAYGRAVTHLCSYGNGQGRKPGATTYREVGGRVMQLVLPAAMSFVERVRRDVQAERELVKQSTDWTAEEKTPSTLDQNS